MPKCSACDAYTSDTTARFCSQCGAAYPEENKLPYIGVSGERGIWRVTFPPQEGEFNHEDELNDAIRASAWNDDHEFEGEVKKEFLRSTVTTKTHPYECSKCLQDQYHTHIVSATAEGRCEMCGEQHWVLRDT